MARTDKPGQPSLMAEMGISEREIAQRKAWLEFDATDVERLLALNPIAQGYADPVIGELYEHFLSFAETREFFRDPKTLEYVKNMQKAYFLRLTQGDYDAAYIEERVNVGAVHERIGLDLKWYLGAYNFYMRAIARRIFEVYKDDTEQAREVYFALQKLIFLDIGLALDTYIFQRERTIRQQQEAIRLLSTPALQVRERLLILPIVGMIDTQRARQLTEQLLRAIRANRAKVVVVDITGVPIVDSNIANHLVQTAEAARLMGAYVIITGLSAEVAQTLANLGLDLTKLNTVGDLQGGIEEAERRLGYKVIKVDNGDAHDDQEMHQRMR